MEARRSSLKEKQAFRRKMAAIREEIPEELRRQKSQRVCQRLLAEPWYEQTQEILVYSAIRSELDLRTFCENAWQKGKKLYFPRVLGEEMEFYRADSYGQLSPGCFGVMEPDGTTEHWTADDGQSVVLVPGLAFSEKGSRIGYGKGYYDRYLSGHQGLMTIGVCYEEQINSAIPMERHDRMLDIVVTDQNRYETEIRRHRDELRRDM